MKTAKTLARFAIALLLTLFVSLTAPTKTAAADNSLTPLDFVGLRQNLKNNVTHSNIFQVTAANGSNYFALKNNNQTTNGPIITIQQAGVVYEAVPYFEFVATNRLTGLLQTNKVRNGIITTN